MRSSLLDDTTAGPGHSTALWASHRRVFPVPGGANPRMWGAVSNGTRRSRRRSVTHPPNGVMGERNPVLATNQA